MSHRIAHTHMAVVPLVFFVFVLLPFHVKRIGIYDLEGREERMQNSDVGYSSLPCQHIKCLHVINRCDGPCLGR